MSGLLTEFQIEQLLKSSHLVGGYDRQQLINALLGNEYKIPSSAESAFADDLFTMGTRAIESGMISEAAMIGFITYRSEQILDGIKQILSGESSEGPNERALSTLDRLDFDKVQEAKRKDREVEVKRELDQRIAERKAVRDYVTNRTPAGFEDVDLEDSDTSRGLRQRNVTSGEGKSPPQTISGTSSISSTSSNSTISSNLGRNIRLGTIASLVGVASAATTINAATIGNTSQIPITGTTPIVNPPVSPVSPITPPPVSPSNPISNPTSINPANPPPINPPVNPPVSPINPPTSGLGPVADAKLDPVTGFPIGSTEDVKAKQDKEYKNKLDQTKRLLDLRDKELTPFSYRIKMQYRPELQPIDPISTEPTKYEVDRDMARWGEFATLDPIAAYSNVDELTGASGYFTSNFDFSMYDQINSNIYTGSNLIGNGLSIYKNNGINISPTSDESSILLRSQLNKEIKKLTTKPLFYPQIQLPLGKMYREDYLYSDDILRKYRVGDSPNISIVPILSYSTKWIDMIPTSEFSRGSVYFPAI